MLLASMYDFYIKSRLLINMHDITITNNSTHLQTMGYQCTPYDMYPMYRSWDFVFTSFLDKITLSSAPTHINDIQHFEIIKTYILANKMITLNIKENRHAVVKL